MTVENAIDTYLRADSTLCSYIGGSTPRIYWMQAPENATLPYLVYTKVSDPDDQQFFAKDTGRARIQFDIVSTTKASYVIDERLRTLMRGITGTMGGLTVTLVSPINRRSRFNADTTRYVWSSDYEVMAQY